MWIWSQFSLLPSFSNLVSFAIPRNCQWRGQHHQCFRSVLRSGPIQLECYQVLCVQLTLTCSYAQMRDWFISWCTSMNKNAYETVYHYWLSWLHWPKEWGVIKLWKFIGPYVVLAKGICWMCALKEMNLQLK